MRTEPDVGVGKLTAILISSSSDVSYDATFADMASSLGASAAHQGPLSLLVCSIIEHHVRSSLEPELHILIFVSSAHSKPLSLESGILSPALQGRLDDALGSTGLI